MQTMTKPFLAVAVASALTTAIFIGCGSEPSVDIPTDDAGDESSSSSSSSSSSGGSSSGGDASNDATSVVDGQTCNIVGQPCSTANDCCAKTCNKVGAATVGECAPPPGGNTCLAAGAQCVSSTQCCTNACIGNVCSAAQCKADSPVAENCATNAECCSGQCDVGGTGKCLTLGGGATCRTEGNPCALNADCCSQQCDSTKHCSNISFCTQTGDVCANDFECCGGSCDKVAGATLGRCSTVGSASCAPSGTVCTGTGCDNFCCSLSCGPYAGIKICQPPSGCKPQNELCAVNDDCCGGPSRPKGIEANGSVAAPIMCVVEPGDTFGRCPFEQCLRPGAVCKVEGNNCGGTSNNCCEGKFLDGGQPSPSFCNSNPEKCCTLDGLGIPRCRATIFDCTVTGPPPAGTQCSTSADCCGRPCVNNKCEGTCVPKGGMCTVSADCCAPQPCVVPTGSTMGICGGTIQSDGGVAPPPDSGTPTDGGTTDGGTPTDAGCALYGQSCTSSGNCCDGVPCTSGTCRYP